MGRKHFSFGVSQNDIARDYGENSKTFGTRKVVYKKLSKKT